MQVQTQSSLNFEALARERAAEYAKYENETGSR